MFEIDPPKGRRIALQLREPLTKGVWGLWLGCTLLAAVDPYHRDGYRAFFYGTIYVEQRKRIFEAGEIASKYLRTIDEWLYFRASEIIDRDGGPTALLRAPNFLHAQRILNDIEGEVKWIRRIVDVLISLHHYRASEASLGRAVHIVSSVTYDGGETLSPKPLRALWKKYKEGSHVIYALSCIKMPLRQTIGGLNGIWFTSENGSFGVRPEWDIALAVRVCKLARAALVDLSPKGGNPKEPLVKGERLGDPETALLWRSMVLKRFVEGDDTAKNPFLRALDDREIAASSDYRIRTNIRSSKSK
jgi:hypothetical protein